MGTKKKAITSELEQTTAAALPDEGRGRVVIEDVRPQIDGGRFAIKCTVGEDIEVEADAFTDGHDQIACVLRYRSEADGAKCRCARSVTTAGTHASA
jgi:hypothetical protein